MPGPFELAGGFAGGWAGGDLGALGGGAAGTLVEPIGGTAVGGVAGGILGSKVGSAAGGALGSWIDNKLGLGDQSLCGGNCSAMSKKSKKSGKEKASDTPSWAKGQKPNPGENGKDFAGRLLESV